MTKRLIGFLLLIGFVPFLIGTATGAFVVPRIIHHYLKPKPSADVHPVSIIVPAPGFPAERFEDTPTNYSPAPKDGPPPTVLIGPYRWKIRYVRLGPGGFAVSYPKHLEIDLDATLPRDQLAETLLHEILHGCLFIGGGGAASMQDNQMIADDFIEQSAPTMVQVFRDNPELVKWLAAR